MTVLGVVPARSGSKGLPRKNVRSLGGRPLIVHTLDAGLASRSIDRLIVSTDDDEIADIARSTGADVPFRRPAHLATDSASQIDVVQHALHWAEDADGRTYEAVVLLQPSSPFRTSEDIDAAVRILRETAADSVISLGEPLHDNPFYAYTLDGDRPVPLVEGVETGARRQDLPRAFIRNGAVYAARRAVILERGSFFGSDLRGFVMPRERSLNIDDQLDLELAEFLLPRRVGW